MQQMSTLPILYSTLRVVTVPTLMTGTLDTPFPAALSHTSVTSAGPIFATPSKDKQHPNTWHNSVAQMFLAGGHSSTLDYVARTVTNISANFPAAASVAIRTKFRYVQHLHNYLLQ